MNALQNIKTQFNSLLAQDESKLFDIRFRIKFPDGETYTASNLRLLGQNLVENDLEGYGEDASITPNFLSDTVEIVLELAPMLGYVNVQAPATAFLDGSIKTTVYVA